MMMMRMFAGLGVTVSVFAIMTTAASASLLENFNAAGPAGTYAGANFTFSPGHPNAQTAPFETSANSTSEFLRLKVLTPAFYRSFNAVGFDQTDPGLFGRIIVDFDYRLTCGGNHSISTSGVNFGCADGFSVGLMNTETFGTTGIPFTLSENGGTAGGPARHKSFALGFNTFNNLENSNNSLNLNWNGSRVGPTQHLSTFNLATGQNGVFGGFHHVHIDLTLAGTPMVTVRLTDSVGNTVTPYNAYDLSGILVDGLGVGPYDSRLGFFTRTGDSREGVDLDNIQVQYLEAVGAPVPLPAALPLFGTAIAGLGCAAWRRRRVA